MDDGEVESGGWMVEMESGGPFSNFQPQTSNFHEGQP